MRLSFIFFIYLGFIVSAKKHKVKIGDDYEDESPPSVKTVLNLRGKVRKLFALEAAFVDHARNMICSPLSVLMPLGKLALGAEKKSQQELLEAIGLSSRRQIRKSFGDLIKNLEYLPGVTLDVASRIYVSSESTINSKFLKRTRSIFKSSCQKMSPTDAAGTAKTINDWVASKTRDKIKHLINPSDISRDTSVILVNAIYFAGNWKDSFGEPYIDDFHSPSGVRRIPMMRNQGLYNYWKCDTLNAEILEIPYEGEKCSMIIVLPYSNSGLPVLLRALKLAPELLNSALVKMKQENVIVAIPKFKIETELNLNPLYQKMGLRTIFDPQKSDLLGIIDDEKVFVSKSIHKAIIEVNEKGTEAAAATAIAVHLSAPLNVPIFNANRPFMFNIVCFKEQLFAGIFSGIIIQLMHNFLNSNVFRANRPFIFYILLNKEQLFAGIFSE